MHMILKYVNDIIPMSYTNLSYLKCYIYNLIIIISSLIKYGNLLYILFLNSFLSKLVNNLLRKPCIVLYIDISRR